MTKLLIPYPNFAVCAMVLSERHLRENIRSTDWLDSCIRGKIVGYRAHPLVQQWKRHLDAVRVLHDCCVRELFWRGCSTRSPLRLGDATPFLPGYTVPPHIGDFKFHAHQRAHLLDSSSVWYAQWGWTDEPGRIA